MYEEIEDLNEKHRIPTVSMHTRGVCGYVLQPHARALRDCRLHVGYPVGGVCYRVWGGTGVGYQDTYPDVS